MNSDEQRRTSLAIELLCPGERPATAASGAPKLQQRNRVSLSPDADSGDSQSSGRRAWRRSTTCGLPPSMSAASTASAAAIRSTAFVPRNSSSKMNRCGSGRSLALTQREHGLDLDQVVALPRNQIVGPADAAAHLIDRRLVGAGQTRVDRLRQHDVDADRAEKRGLARHVRAGHEHAVRRRQRDRIRHRLVHERMPKVGERRGESGDPKRGRIHPSVAARNDATAIAASISPTASMTRNKCGVTHSSSRLAKYIAFASRRSRTLRNSRMTTARSSVTSGSRLSHRAMRRAAGATRDPTPGRP